MHVIWDRAPPEGLTTIRGRRGVPPLNLISALRGRGGVPPCTLTLRGGGVPPLYPYAKGGGGPPLYPYGIDLGSWSSGSQDLVISGFEHPGIWIILDSMLAETMSRGRPFKSRAEGYLH